MILCSFHKSYKQIPHLHFMGFGYRNITIFVMVGVFGFLLGSFGINSSNIDNSLQTDSVMALGHLQLILTDADGNIKHYVQTNNLITNEGANTMADLIFGTNLNNNVTDAQFEFIGIGTGTTPADFSDVSLQSPISGCANQTVSSVIGQESADLGAGTPHGAEVGFFGASFSGSNCSGTISEAVLQNHEFGRGEVLSHKVFTPTIELGPNDSLSVNWFIEIGGAGGISGP